MKTKAIIFDKDGKLFLGMPTYDPLVMQAHRIADRYHIMQLGNFIIFNFKRVVESFMREKSLHVSAGWQHNY